MASQSGDHTRTKSIMQQSDPVMQKRCVKGMPVHPDWNQNMSITVMSEGIRAKFTQNRRLMDYLLQTGTTELVEAAPYDSFWGVGLPMNSPDILDKSKWKGKNMLGTLLTKLRDSLKSD